MQRKPAEDIIQSSIFPRDLPLLHGFTTKFHGDMRDPARRSQMFAPWGIPLERIYYPRQIHGAEVACIESLDPVDVSKVDACVASPTLVQPYVLIAHVGDCAPILFYDPVTGTTGAAHAGWKGTVLHIASRVIETMIRLGSGVADIRVTVGPHIGTCCYDVDDERVATFGDTFGLSSIGRTTRGLLSLDIGYGIRSDLVEAGIKEENIDMVPGKACTHCTPERFYSFRRKNEPFGEIIGFIGRASRDVCPIND